MKVVKKEVDITEDNYKGYVELYKYKVDPFSNQFYISEIKDGLKILGLTFLTTLLGASTGLLDNGLLQLLTSISLTVGSAFYLTMKTKNYEEINIKDILNEYPNIENIDVVNLEKSLEKVGLIKENELDIKGYETKLKCDKIIEETINKQKYEIQNLIADYNIIENDLQRVKQKIRNMNKR